MRILKWLGIALAVGIAGLFLAGLIFIGPMKMTLMRASLVPKGPEAAPTIVDFDREAAVAALQDEVYGRAPDAFAVSDIAVKTFAFRGGAARFYDITLRAGVVFDGVSETTRPFGLSLVLPPAGAPMTGIIVWQSFSPRGAAIPDPRLPEPTEETMTGGMPGPAVSLLEGVFGRYIQRPPVEMILDTGWGLGVMHPPEYVPDRAREGLAELRRLSAGHADEDTRWGAVLAWAYGHSAALDALTDLELMSADDAFVAAGHSRYGKSALVAAMIDPRIDAVISHQSGTGGASLNREKAGESVAEITESYPHWFAPSYAGFAGREDEMSVDQHHLLAAIAPRPVLLGNARRDVWSDPNGALRAALGADGVWEAMGADGLTVERLDDFDPAAGLVLWLRPGTHGITEEDWPAFLSFLDVQFD